MGLEHATSILTEFHLNLDTGLCFFSHGRSYPRGYRPGIYMTTTLLLIVDEFSSFDL